MSSNLSVPSTSTPPVRAERPDRPDRPAKTESAHPTHPTHPVHPTHPEHPTHPHEDTVKLSDGQQPEVLTYDKPKATAAAPDLQAMMAEAQKNSQVLIDQVKALVEQQGLDFKLVVSGDQKLSVDQATIDKAKADISEDGEWGVKKVAERILSFAKNAMGDDPAKLQKIRDAVELGFSQAKEALGGALPEISQKTHDTIMAEFDRWEKEGIPTGTTVSLDKPDVSADKTS